MTIPEKTVFIAGIILLLLFNPLISQVFNSGSVAGSILALCIILLSFFHRRVFDFIRMAYKKTTGKIIVSALLILLSALIIFALTVSVMIIARACKTPGEDTPTTVIVLGCKVNGTRPSQYLMSRIKAAYKYLSENEDAVCILSGGQGPDEGISEAEAMYNHLLGMGIEKERMYLETRTSSTHKNLEFSKEIIVEHRLSQNIAVVTNSFHQLRTSMIASELGMEVCSVNAHLVRPSYPTYFLREIMGVAYKILIE